jgi:hypothetical protein
MEEKKISQQESIQIITEMIGKVKPGFHESGISAVLWGTVIGTCGLVSFAENFWNFYIGFDIWLLTLAAIIPQVVISIRESRQRKVLTHIEWAANTVWMVYSISIFALVFYLNIVPNVSDKLLAAQHIFIEQRIEGGITTPFHYQVPSPFSLFLLLYAIPTMVGGIVYRFRIMAWGAVLCYVFFIISCFTPTTYDLLLNGLAGIFNWLIPGLVLRVRIYRKKKAANV